MAAGLALLSAQAATAQNGIPALKKVQAAYLGLNSYSQTVSTTLISRVANRQAVAGQTSELRYQKPNRIYISVSSPESGSVVTYNNGKEMLVYRGKLNAYQKASAKPTVKAYVAALRAYGIGTMLDPLAFLTGDPVQSALTSAAMKGSAVLEGAKCDVVAGTIAPALAGKAKTATATFWIDKATNLLRKVEIVTKGVPATARMRVMVKGKPVVKSQPIQIDTTITMNIRNVKVNPPLNDASFTFQPPANAILQDPAKALKR
jgi:outer membrane lipoprotein-sorting protein